MRCAACQTESPPTARFCGECAHPLARCGACGFDNPAGFNYCGQCGTKLDTSPRVDDAQRSRGAEPSPPLAFSEAERERRQVTIMFCDLVGSTALSARLDAEDLRDLLGEYKDLCESEVERFQGFVHRWAGDGMLACFGYPQAHDDDAVCAVKAALAIVARMPRLSALHESDLGTPLQVHIGIHTGEVIAEQSAITGEAPNIAARLEGIAEPGTIVTSRQTRNLVKHAVECEPLGVASLKGVPAPIEVFRVVGERHALQESGVFEPPSLSPLLGRDEELAVLKKQWETVFQGHGRCQLICGEPGIGKSRLLLELSTWLRAQGTTPLRCQCAPHFSNTALHPFLELLERELGMSAEEPAASRMNKLRAAFDSGEPEACEALPLIAQLMSIPTAPSTAPTESARKQRDQLMECLLRWLLAPEPLALLVEDVHWADASTLELLALLVDQLGSAPLLLVVTFRPEFTAPWSNRSVVNHMALSRLSPVQTRELVEHLTQGQDLAPNVLDQMVNRTDGVPLFVEELTKMVVEVGVLAQQEAVNALPIRSVPEAGSIPNALKGPLTARLDQLGQAKSLAQLGAVIGREFSYKLIDACFRLVHPGARQPERELKASLARLVGAELLYQKGLPPNSHYSFKHALIQETAYELLVRDTRFEYHRQVAAALEQHFPELVESHPELVAQHYEGAKLGEKAIVYWQKAGARALEASADAEAVVHLRRALAQIALLPESENRMAGETSCLVRLGSALTAVKGYAAPEVAETYERALLLCEHTGNTDLLLETIGGLTSHYQVRGPLNLARKNCERLIELARARDDTTWLAQAHRRLGWCLFCQGQLELGRQHLEHALQLYDRTRSHVYTRVQGAHPWVIGSVNLALLEWFAGHPDNAVVRSREGVARARELSSPLTLAYALSMSAAIHQCRGEIDPTLRLASEALAVATEHDFPYWVAWASVLEGWAIAAAGRVDEGLSKMNSGIAMYHATGALLFVPSSQALLAEVCCSAGRLDQALENVSRALNSEELREGYYYAADIYRVQGELLLANGSDESAAEACFANALRIAQQQGARSLELRSAVSLGELRKRQGKATESHTLVLSALDGFDVSFDTVDVRRARALLSVH